MPKQTTATAVSVGKAFQFMTLSEATDELDRLDARRKLLMRVIRLLKELDGTAPDADPIDPERTP